MYEKVSPMHPDKIADRIAGAIVDLAYTKAKDPKIAVEVMIGHGRCHIIMESSEYIPQREIELAVWRIAENCDYRSVEVDITQVKQDPHLAANQERGFRCGDNGIFRCYPITEEEQELTDIAKRIYEVSPRDGKYILAGNELIICQSGSYWLKDKLPEEALKDRHVRINPIGEWKGGIDVDTGCANRKLGSDLGRSVTGGGLHGKDLSKADVSVTIFCFLLAQQAQRMVEAYCAIGDDTVTVRIENGKKATLKYKDIVEAARGYIKKIGGFEKLADWGLIR